MRIVIRPPGSSDDDQVAIASEIKKAIGVLRSSYIPTDAGGAFERDGEISEVTMLHFNEIAELRCESCCERKLGQSPT
jgi:hypothetical protein